MAAHSAPAGGTGRAPGRRRTRRAAARSADLERRYDGAIPANLRSSLGARRSAAAADRAAALRFWRHEVSEAIAALRLWRSGGDLRRDAVSPAVAALREATLARRVAAAWQRYRLAQSACV